MIRRAAPLAVFAALSALATAAPRVEFSGNGPVRDDDPARLRELLAAAWRRRFRAAPGDLRVVLSAVDAREARIEARLAGPAAPAGLLDLTLELRAEDWRRALDREAAPGFALHLERFVARLTPGELLGEGPGGAEEIRQAVHPGGVPDLKALGDALGGGRAAAREKVADRLSRELQARGVPQAGDGRLSNPWADPLWLRYGELGFPLSQPGVVALRVAVGPDLAPAATVLAGIVNPRGRQVRVLAAPERYAYQRRLAAKLARRWRDLERRAGGELYCERAALDARGALRLEGRGYVSLDAEVEAVRAAGRRHRWRPTLLVNPSR